MRKKLLRVVLACGACLGLCIANAMLLGQCGVERWSVKTGTDADAGSVNLASTMPTTIASLVALSAPQPIPVNNRVSPTETTVWVIDATLTSFKVEGDSDYHLVIADANGASMIAEIPSPDCVSGSSPFNSLITQARAKFDSTFTASSSFQDVSMPVRITGIGMFDFLHGQRGVAPNGIEIHPVTGISFNTGPASDFSITPSPSSLSLSSGSSGTVAISVNPLGNAGPSVSMAASGLPQGINVSIAPNPVSSGSSTTATVAVDASTIPGSYTVNISGTDGTTTHTASITVVVSGSSTQTPDFQLSASPASLAVGVGGSNSVSISTSPVAGFSGEVSLSVSGLPQGVSSSLHNSTISTPGTSTLTITTDATAVVGTATATITGNGSGITHSAVVNLTICSGAAPSSPLSAHMAARTEPTVASFHDVSESAGSPAARDEDDSIVQVLPTPAALSRARLHAEAEICHPREFAVFLGHGWSDNSNSSLKKALARSKPRISGPICGAGVRTEYMEKTLSNEPFPSALSDLQTQARLVDALQRGALQAPTDQTIYVVFLAPEIRSTLGSSVGGQDYFAYENHFHAFNGEIHYVVVPFDTDSMREVSNASRAVLRAIIAR
jgi:hypothetical protein